MTALTLPELTNAGNALEVRFKELAADTRSPDFIALVADLHRWLRDCVDHGRYLPAGTPERRTLQGQVDYWTSRLLRTGHAFDDIDRIAAFDSAAGRVLPDALFPYHGLLAVTDAGSKLFFGREEQTQEYANDLEDHCALLIQSESGGGKSSVAMAGVLPELRRRHADWLVLPRVAPGMRPADTLRAALAALLATPASTDGRLDAATVQAALAGRTLLVYVDQLEELLTMCADVHQQAEFSELLAALTQAGDLRLLATLRIDHYDRLAQSASCHQLFTLFARAGSVKTLLPMSLAQIRSVILKPAETVGLRFVPASIVETLASESASTPSGLPLLQFALQRLWDERPTREGVPLDLITKETYAKLPTLPTALSSVAERYYDEIVQEGLADACKRLMLELTVIDERLEVPLRRRRAESELIDVFVLAGLASGEQARKVIDGLVAQRLIVRTGEGDARQIEVAHEALFRSWPRFQDWIHSDEVRTTLREAKQIARDALLWEQGVRSPDLLNLRGAPLDKALGHRRAYWLDPQTATYVDACEAAALQQAKRDADALEAMRLTRRGAKQTRWILAFGGLVVAVLALILWYREDAAKRDAEAAIAMEGERRAAADKLAQEKAIGAANAVTSAVRNLKPLDALDLAYTLQQHKGSLESLAHAIDRLAGGVLVGERKHGGAYLTASGQAAVQLARNDQGDVSMAYILPLGAGQAPGAAPVSIRLDADPHDQLIALDVGPRITGSGEARLAIANFVRREARGTTDTVRELTRMLVYRIEPGKPALAVADRPYGKSTTGSSDIAFDSSGLGTAVTALQGSEPSSLTSEVLRWSTPDGNPERVALVPGGGRLVTAVAFGGVDGQQLITGRSDGSVECAGGRAIAGADTSTVRSLRGAAGTTQYVALHESRTLTVGDCQDRKAFELEKGSTGPRNLLLHAAGKTGGAILTYTLDGKLRCIRVSGGRNLGRCWGNDLAADQAVPAFGVSRNLLGYRALTDNAEPLLMFFDASATASRQDGRSTPKGMPTARRTPNNLNLVAASPNGEYSVKLEVGAGNAPASVLRRDASDKTPLRVPVASPERLAVNDQGIAVVLSGPIGRTISHSISSISAAGVLGTPTDMGFRATCLKMSPDGARALVAGERWETSVAAIAADGTKLVASRDGGNRRGASVSACAIGDGENATMVLASRDGEVLQHAPDSQDWRSVSELIAFRLGVAALDVSIDAASRFVAVVGERLTANCQNGMDGHPLRIWDLKGKRPDIPVASTCLPSFVQAIGALQVANERWVLPVYELRDRQLSRFDYPCLACEGRDGQDAMAARLKDAAARFQVKLLDSDRSVKIYGFAP